LSDCSTLDDDACNVVLNVDTAVVSFDATISCKRTAAADDVDDDESKVVDFIIRSDDDDEVDCNC
jgi:hypothetical protein